MTSLVFGTGFLIHKGLVKHHRDKQRQKNYERWEGLRDEYDEMKRAQRSSLDSEGPSSVAGSLESPDRPVFTLRDRQEAHDAQTSWRPQEAWEPIPRNSQQASREDTVPVIKHKTGAMWDESLPEPLRVTRRHWDEGGEWPDNTSSHRGTSAAPSIRSERGGSAASARRSPSLDREDEPARKREQEVDVVESPFEWWKQ